jgi:hypothetical protein
MNTNIRLDHIFEDSEIPSSDVNVFPKTYSTNGLPTPLFVSLEVISEAQGVSLYQEDRYSSETPSSSTLGKERGPFVLFGKEERSLTQCILEASKSISPALSNVAGHSSFKTYLRVACKTLGQYSFVQRSNSVGSLDEKNWG